MLLSAAGCGKDEYNYTDFSHITARDVNAQLTGEIDSTDWRSDETWNEQEQKLFVKYSFYQHDENPEPAFSPVAYPNAVTSQGVNILIGAMNLDHRLHVRIVDASFKVLVKADELPPQAIAIDLAGVPANLKHVRMYYMLTLGNKCVGKGHGDLRME